jgi:hypothetical protein
MIVRNGAREYAHFAWDGAPDDANPPEILGIDGEWHPMEWWTGEGRAWERVLDDLDTTPEYVTAGLVRISRVLLTTPDADPGPGVLFPAGTTPAQVRLVDTPEVVIRGDGRVTVL